MSDGRGSDASAGSREPRRYPVKLVRDGVAKYLDADNTVTYEPTASREEYIPLLRAKLLEEVGEYLLDPCLNELADVLEVVRALAENDLQEGFTAVMDESHRKFIDRGGFTGEGFDGGTVMVVRTTAPENYDKANETRADTPASTEVSSHSGRSPVPGRPAGR